MQIMQVPLKILMVAGCWPPISWSPICRMIYNIYTIFITLLLLTFMLPQLMDIILIVDNPDDFTDTFYVMLAMFMACCKMFSLLLNRKNIKIFVDMLIEKPFRPLEPDEIKVRQKFNNMIQTNTIWYTILVEMTCATMTLTSLLTDFRKKNLAYREWIPYGYSSDTVYYVVYFRQQISLTTASVVNVACDSIICGLLLHICSQIEILECRLKKSLRNRIDLGECIYLHDSIYKFADKINETFRFIIAVQFSVSMLVVCSNLYRCVETTLSAKYIPLILYTFSMFTQILIYCWFGNEVKLKSIQFADEVFGMDWVTENKNVKNNLMMIMNRSTVPIELSSAHILNLNLDSFVKLLKTSYSAYSILQHM